MRFSPLMSLSQLFFLGFALPLASAATEKPSTVSIQVDHIEENRIYFKKADGTVLPDPVKTNLFDLTQIGELQPQDAGAAPYFIFAASPCKDCVQDRTLYMIRPTGGRPTPFVYPGRIVDQKTGITLVDSRAFYGKCLSNHKDVYVVFQKEKIPRKRRGVSTQQSVFVAEPTAGRLDERLIDHNLPRIDYTLKRVRAKDCFEISGRHRSTRPLGSTSPAAPDPDDDEDDDATGSPSTSAAPGGPTAGG